MKLKHNAGNKSDRINFAKSIAYILHKDGEDEEDEEEEEEWEPYKKDTEYQFDKVAKLIGIDFSKLDEKKKRLFINYFSEHNKIIEMEKYEKKEPKYELTRKSLELLQKSNAQKELALANLKELLKSLD
mmetsp:Transcript_34429/g.33627  ORF Transcript_34429/g.33627 Transcript_34429/m.33627 type:complete len:129 (-) Transcript_34429:76-462(-)|eukprot:CAMPEP_0170548810 /NCGR_PEP_ID=MMETSP0211-20121228/6994_1 /TAXON_ID=311385 /ORGANISM="Pseudokeronopsis sp., Strain OXSARD2" /LENGTH=128 /DNA_ID=CAMNT_0010854451 /DNA_START=1385 /DNA_END=1771 /DNA_ORIENTATION=-